MVDVRLAAERGDGGGVERGRRGDRGPAALDAALAAMTTAPARRYGLAGKGSLDVGSDADVVVYDPQASWQVDESCLHSNAGWGPYHGMSQRGRVVTTLVRGRTVYDDGQLRGSGGDGALVGSDR